MIAKSLLKSKYANVPVQILKGKESVYHLKIIPLEIVVAALVFCSFTDPEKAVKELKRVCRNDGRILLFEHVRMKNPFLAHLQNLLTPFWKKVCDGCCLNRDTLSLFQNSGFQIERVKKF